MNMFLLHAPTRETELLCPRRIGTMLRTGLLCAESSRYQFTVVVRNESISACSTDPV